MMNNIYRWEQLTYLLKELSENIDKTIYNSEFNHYVNSISGCSTRIELVNVLGNRHELGISFDVWRGIHADPGCSFTAAEDEKYCDLADDLVLRLNRNMTKWLRKLQLDQLLVYPEANDCFCIFHESDRIAVEAMGGFHLLVDLV